MKDPLDPEERAYEVLGVGRNATLSEINAAYAMMAAQNPSLRRQLTHAWQQLRKSATRFKEDFWYYQVGDDENAGKESLDKRQALHLDPALPVSSADLCREHTDLAKGRYHKSFTDIEFRPMKLSDSERYDEDPGYALPIVFDR